jgi:hypothetical protein
MPSFQKIMCNINAFVDMKVKRAYKQKKCNKGGVFDDLPCFTLKFDYLPH